MAGEDITGSGDKLTKEIQKMMKTSEKNIAEEMGSLIHWKIEGKGKKVKVDAEAKFKQVDVSTISSPKRVKALGEVSLLGYKISLADKIDSFKENYIKNYAQTKSHNYLMSKFAMLKVAFLGQMLSMLGMSSEDIRKLQKQAIESSIDENQALFNENEYNSELIEIVGGAKKKIRAQKKAIDEIRRQLRTQANNLGIGHYYTQRRIIEIKLEQSRAILGNFIEEKSNLEYQLEYMA